MDFIVLFQDIEGELSELAGQTCEYFYCVQGRDENTGNLSPAFFWLKVREGLWHRFFIDRRSVLHWHVCDELDRADLTNENCPVLDLAVSYGFNGLAIGSISMHQLSGTRARLAITFSDHRVCTVEHTVDTGLVHERTHLMVQ